MADGVLLKVAALVGFILIIGGGTVAVQDYLSPGDVSVKALTREVAIQPGHAASVGVLLTNGGSAAERVTLSVVDADGVVTGAGAASVEANPGVEVADMVTISVPEGTPPGERRVTIRATGEGESARGETTVRVKVLAEGATVDEDERAEIYYVGRLADGRFFNTNLPGYTEAPFPRTDFYRASPGNLTIQTGPTAPNVITGFWRGIVGMQVGETRTITIAPADAYGEKLITDVIGRETALEREFTLDVRPLTRPFASFADHVSTTGQGEGSSFAVNDTFTLAQAGNTWTFRITVIDGESVTYVPAPPVGARFTLPTAPAWPNASEVTSVNDTHIVFFTTPTTDVGERFTFFDYWPAASEIATLNATHVVVKHSPAVGTTYSPPGAGGAPGPENTVVAVRDDEIEVTVPSGNPLAGETLVFDVVVLRIVG